MHTYIHSYIHVRRQSEPACSSAGFSPTISCRRCLRACSRASRCFSICERVVVACDLGARLCVHVWWLSIVDPCMGAVVCSSVKVSDMMHVYVRVNVHAYVWTQCYAGKTDASAHVNLSTHDVYHPLMDLRCLCIAVCAWAWSLHGLVRKCCSARLVLLLNGA